MDSLKLWFNTNLLLKMELSQNLWQTFACDANEKQIFCQIWSCHKIYGRLFSVLHKKKLYQKWSCDKIHGCILDFFMTQYLLLNVGINFTATKIYGKYKIFLMAVYMNFKYRKILYFLVAVKLIATLSNRYWVI